MLFGLVLGLGVVLGQAKLSTSQGAWTFYLLTTLDVAGIWVTLRPFRKGRRWAWYFLWYVPAEWIGEALFVFVAVSFYPGLAAAVLPGQSFDASFYGFNTFFAILSFLGLFLPYRKFFPKKSVIGADSA